MTASANAVQDRVRQLMAALTPEARLRMASHMFATGRSLALAGQWQRDIDRRVFLFERLYRSDFSEAERGRILQGLQTSP